MITRAKNQKVSSRLLKRTLAKAKIDPSSRGLSEVLRDEYKAYYNLKKDAKQLRMNALEELATASADQGNVSQEKMLKALREREQQRVTARKVRFIQGKYAPAAQQW